MVLCSGCFDGIHAGHVAYLAAAKLLCAPEERLAVSVADDAYIREAKGREPYWPHDERLLAVAALRMVDYVSGTDVPTMIEQHRPRYFVKGVDWRGRPLPVLVKQMCAEHETQIVYVPTQGTHTSEARG